MYETTVRRTQYGRATFDSTFRAIFDFRQSQVGHVQNRYPSLSETTQFAWIGHRGQDEGDERKTKLNYFIVSQ